MADAVSGDRIICAKAGLCSGCDLVHLDRNHLTLERSTALKRLGLFDVPVQTRWIEAGGLRDRLEFTLELTSVAEAQEASPRLGLFAIAPTSSSPREIVDIDVCPQLSTNLQAWLSEFRKDLPPLEARGSVRLRVSPTNLRGVWLDFANEDILNILEEGQWLERQLTAGVIVEMGQKRKRAVRADSGPRSHKLTEVDHAPWFQSWVYKSGSEKLAPTPLFGAIGTFTQPGFQANQVLVETVLQHAKISHPNFDSDFRIAEFGAGIGNFTLPLLSTGAAVHVFESDRVALEALHLGVEAAGLDRSRLTVHVGDFILSSKAAERAKTASGNFDFNLVIVDPPRPGLGDFISSLAENTRGADWVYVSCYPESFAKDRVELERQGLKLQSITIVEQFPFTRHFEIVASFSA